MFERFTERARQVIVLGQEEARGMKHNYLGTEHLLLGLLREEEGLAARVLDGLGVTLDLVRDAVLRSVGEGDEVIGGQLPMTPRTKKVIELALREALSLGHNYIGTEHILLGLAREDKGVAARVLVDFDATGERLRNEVIRMLTGPRRFALGQPGQWGRTDVDLGQIWQRGAIVYRVVAIADSPTVTIENIATGEWENHVIASANFGAFTKLGPTA